jgi:hypothetical protein
MYGSVEMLLKFCAANFSSECTASRIREKQAQAHTSRFGKKEISRWHSRYLPRSTPTDRIHLALVNFSTKISLIFFAATWLRE